MFEAGKSKATYDETGKTGSPELDTCNRFVPFGAVACVDTRQMRMSCATDDETVIRHAEVALSYRYCWESHSFWLVEISSSRCCRRQPSLFQPMHCSIIFHLEQPSPSETSHRIRSRLATRSCTEQFFPRRCPAEVCNPPVRIVNTKLLPMPMPRLGGLAVASLHPF